MWKNWWWFGAFFNFPYSGNNHPNWRIFFRGVQTTNHKMWELTWRRRKKCCCNCRQIDTAARELTWRWGERDRFLLDTAMISSDIWHCVHVWRRSRFKWLKSRLCRTTQNLRIAHDIMMYPLVNCYTTMESYHSQCEQSTINGHVQ